MVHSPIPPSWYKRKSYTVCRYPLDSTKFLKEFWTGAAWVPDQSLALRLAGQEAYELIDQFARLEAQKDEPEWRFSLDHLSH